MSFGIRDVVITQFVENASKFGAQLDDLLARGPTDPGAMHRAVAPLRQTFGGLSANVEHLSLWAPDALAALPDGQAGKLQRLFADAWAISDDAERRGSYGADLIPTFQALRQTMDGVAELMGSQSSVVRSTHVVVGGGGTAGLTTANLLRGMGAEVTLIAPMPDARRGSVMVDRRAWGVLEQAGAGRTIRTSPADPSGDYRMTSIDYLEQDLRGTAANLGVNLRYSREVAGIEELEDGVRVVTRDAGQRGNPSTATIDADWYVDATGGRSPVAQDPTFLREPFEGAFSALPSARTFLAANADAVPERPIGWTAPDGSFAINNTQEGLLTAYRGLDEAAGDGAASAEDGAALLRALDVDPSTAVGAPWTFTARQTLARSAAQGRTLIVGDGAGTVMPVKQAGILLAALDAERAANTIMGVRAATAEEVTRAVARYDEQWQLARAEGALFPDPVVTDDIVDDAAEAVGAITERATRAHDTGTRGMHRAFLA